MTAGTVVSLELNYLHTTGPRSLNLEWSGPGLTRQLFTTPNLVSYDYFEGNFLTVDNFRNATPKLSSSVFANPKLFILEWNGQRTAPIQVGASAEVVRNAIESLSNVGAAGGIVTVTRAANGLKYNVTFGGNLWFRPKLMNVIGRPGSTVKPVTTVAITKRDSNSTVTLDNLSRFFKASLPNPNTFPIDNAPMFTPETLLYDDTYPEPYFEPGLMMSGYLQTPAVGGRFDPDYSRMSDSLPKFNVIRTDIGLRVTERAAGSGRDIGYRLNAVKDTNGNSRPITLFKMGGLTFEAVAGSRASLTLRNSEKNSRFICRRFAHCQCTF